MTKTRLLFFIILTEGYVVLACELLAIRQLIPFVGSGAETISIIISAILLPLAIGYHRGGRSFKNSYAKARMRNRKKLSVRRILLKNIVSALAVLAVGLSYPFLEVFFGLLTALGITHRLMQTSIYSALFLVTPVFLLGQTVPLVSNYFSRRKLSEITGKMLFFSTTGSFLGSVFSTIVLMTFIGVHNTVIVTLALLCLLGFLLNGWKATYEIGLSLLIMLILFLINNDATMKGFGIVSDNAYNLVSIVDMPKDEATILNINRSASSKLAKDPAKNFKYYQFIQKNFIDPLAKASTPRDILVIGAGGFTLGLHDTINYYTFVDIDKALKPVSERYFLKESLGENKKFEIASARAFVHNATGRYDLIIIDVFTNIVSIPMECTTREFLLDVKKLLKKDGYVVANVISSPTLEDRFSLRYTNTFASAFPAYTRQVIGDYSAWPESKAVSRANNVLYIYHNNALATDRSIYTDDKNTYSFDRN